ncbi:NPCBM/NEW2 domain-containing protein [candidate division WOR-3 bacterium]|nr:NPCBM/NEW2 domain-containing protein [candidate division WOR-3 bacterium]
MILQSILITILLLSPQDTMVTIEGNNIILKVKSEELKVLKDPDAWIDKLDMVYESYTDLVGDAPYNGEKITIESVDEYPGGWAVAGNPIKWHSPWVAKEFKDINKGNWSFGIIHEISHDFDLDYQWVWEAEFFANYKMVYAAEKLKSKILQRDKWYDYTDIKGLTLDDYYEEQAKLAGEEVYVEDWFHHNDPSLDKFLKVKQDIGWEPVKRTFRMFTELKEEEVPKSPEKKFNLFIYYLSVFSGKNLNPRFVEWGYPIIDIQDSEYLVALNKLDWDITVEIEGENILCSVIGDTSYERGLGTHAKSEIIYKLGGEFDGFESFIGVDCETGNNGSIEFLIYIDGKKRYSSGIMHGGEPAKTISISLFSRKELKLVVKDGGNGITCDHADWADAKIIRKDGSAIYLSEIEPVKSSQEWGELGFDKSVDNNPLTLKRVCNLPVEITASIGDKDIMLAPENGIYRGKLDGLIPGKHRILIKAHRSPYTIYKTSFLRISPPGITFLSDLIPIEVEGSFEPDRNCRNQLIHLDKKTYERGIGVHSNSTVIYKLDKCYKTFKTIIGIDDATNGKGSCVFEVFVDKKNVFESNTMNGSDKPKPVEIDVIEVDELKLIVTDGDGEKSWDWANWADARLEK